MIGTKVTEQLDQTKDDLGNKYALIGHRCFAIVHNHPRRHDHLHAHLHCDLDFHHFVYSLRCTVDMCLYVYMCTRTCCYSMCTQLPVLHVTLSSSIMPSGKFSGIYDDGCFESFHACKAFHSCDFSSEHLHCHARGESRSPRKSCPLPCVFGAIYKVSGIETVTDDVRTMQQFHGIYIMSLANVRCVSERSYKYCRCPLGIVSLFFS